MPIIVADGSKKRNVYKFEQKVTVGGDGVGIATRSQAEDESTVLKADCKVLCVVTSGL